MNEGDDVGYGPRLRGEEYDRSIVELYSNVAPSPLRKKQQEIRRRELDLTIDYRLGKDFPPEKREALWAIQKELDKHPLTLMLKYWFRRFFPKRLLKDAHGLANHVIHAYAKVLNQAELERFFGKEEVENPSLPVDPEQLKM